jgi:hypothetical protein
MYEERTPEELALDRRLWQEEVAEATAIHEAELRGEIPCRWHPDTPAVSYSSGLCEDCYERRSEAAAELRAEARDEDGDA